MLYEYHVSRSVRYYPRFSVTSVGLGTYYPRIRRSTCNSLFGSMSAAAWIQTHQTLLSKWTGTEFTKDVNTSILEETQWRNLWRILTDWLKKSPFILVRHLTLSSATLIHSVPSRHILSIILPAKWPLSFVFLHQKLVSIRLSLLCHAFYMFRQFLPPSTDRPNNICGRV